MIKAGDLSDEIGSLGDSTPDLNVQDEDNVTAEEEHVHQDQTDEQVQNQNEKLLNHQRVII